jgi:regulatory protein
MVDQTLHSAGDVPMKITDVQTQRKRETRRSIFINGEFAFGISEEMYVKYALYKGRELTQEYIDEVLHEEERYQARQVALRFVTRRMRSEQEIRRKLAEKKFPPEAIEATMKFLAEYQMVDDAGFARSYINDQLLRRPMGRRRLGMALREKGVEKEMVDDVLSNAIDDEEELRNAMMAAEKKAPSIRKEDPRKWDQAMASFLAGRGFGWDVVGKVLEHYRRSRKESAE